MKIIGIKIKKGRASNPEYVMKCLKPRWFPFGDYQEPVKKENKWVLVNDHECYRLYQINDNMPQIEVCGIVGMNGSGKSTIIDYLLMIVNNMAYHLLPDNYASDEAKPTYASNIYAKLYFVTDECIYRIKCENAYVFLSDGKHDIPLMGRHANLNKRHNSRELLSKLFYTGVCNYGAYSLNANDYKNGKWLDTVQLTLPTSCLLRVLLLDNSYGTTRGCGTKHPLVFSPSHFDFMHILYSQLM